MDNNSRNIIDFSRRKKESPETPHEPMFNLPPAVKALAITNIACFLIIQYLPALATEQRLYDLAFVPMRYTGAELLTLPALLSPFTHMFIHAGWMHLLFNLGMLLAFGSGVETTLGIKRFFIFYFTCGLAGAFVHFLFNMDSWLPMVGASGAISGLFGGILILMHAIGSLGHGKRTLYLMAGLWIVVSVFFGSFGVPGTDNPIAWTTHVGGFFAGFFLIKPVLKIKKS